MYNQSYNALTQTVTIAGIDPGRNACKAAITLPDGSIVTDKFFSKISNYTKQKIQPKLDSNNMIVTLGRDGEGGKYFVGKLARNAGIARQNFQDSKAHEDTVLLILTALARLGVSGNVKLVTCVPVENHAGDEELLKNLLAKPHWVQLNEKRSVLINIINVIVTAEAVVSSYAVDEDEIEGKASRILNIGSAKSNFGAFDEEGEYQDKHSGSLNEIGWERFERGTNDEEKIKTIVESTHSILCQHDWDKAAFDEYNNEVEVKFYLTGGRAEVMLPEFRKHFPTMATLPNSLYTDAIGCLQVGKLTWEE